MPSNKKYTKEEVLAAVARQCGRLFLVARELQVTYHTIRNYMIAWPEIREAVKDAKGRRLDRAECKLDKAVQNGEPWAIRFLLITQGKHRGYYRETRTKQDVSGQIEHRHTFIDVAQLGLPAEILRQILAQVRAKKEQLALPPGDVIDNGVVDNGQPPASS